MVGGGWDSTNLNGTAPKLQGAEFDAFLVGVELCEGAAGVIMIQAS